MSPFSPPPRPAPDPPTGRLGRLHDDLAGLAGRLCEGIASVAGRHAGEVVRDAVQATLGQARADPAPHGLPYRPYADDGDDPYRAPYAQDPDDGYPDPGGAGGLWPGSYRPAVPPPPVACPPPPWWSLLPAGLQLLAWCLRRRQARRHLLAVLAVGAATVLAGWAVGPGAAILVALAGTALTLAGLAGGLADLVAGLCGQAGG